MNSQKKKNIKVVLLIATDRIRSLIISTALYLHIGYSLVVAEIFLGTICSKKALTNTQHHQFSLNQKKSTTNEFTHTC